MREITTHKVNGLNEVLTINVMDEPIGKSFRFIPISNRKRYLLTVPMGGTPKGILARADDGVHWKPAKGEWDVQLPQRRGLVKWKIEGAGTVRGAGLGDSIRTQHAGQAC